MSIGLLLLLCCAPTSASQHLYVAGLGVRPGPYISVYAMASGAPVLVRTIPAHPHHQAASIASDRSGTLYVVDRDDDSGILSNSIDVYRPGSTKPSRSIRLGYEIEAITVAENRMYAVVDAPRQLGSTQPADFCQAIDVLDLPSAKLQNQIMDGIQCPGYVAVDRLGNLFVRNQGRFTIERYAPGASKPSRTLPSRGSQSWQMALDRSGNLYALDTGHTTASIAKYTPSSQAPALELVDGVTKPMDIVAADDTIYVRDTKAVGYSDAKSSKARVPPFGALSEYDGRTGKKLRSVRVDNRLWYFAGPFTSALGIDERNRLYLLQPEDGASLQGGGHVEVYATNGSAIEHVYNVPIRGTPAFLVIGP